MVIVGRIGNPPYLNPFRNLSDNAAASSSLHQSSLERNFNPRSGISFPRGTIQQWK
jgi:hypothetical protein